MNLLNGSCKCTFVKFQVDLDKIKAIVNCHCNQCRTMNGSAFSTYVAVLDEGFTMICGDDKLKSYPVTTNAQKCFCTNCGTPIFNINPNKYNGLKIVYFGTIQDLKAVVPKANIYCESMLEWVDHLNSIKSFPQTITQ
jgi:hypothetical protein